MNEQESVVIDEFKGLFDRGELKDLNVTQIDPGFFKTLNNFYHQGESLISRPGFATSGVFATTPTRKLLRFWPYRRPATDADAFIAMYVDTGTNLTNIMDSITPATALQAVTTGNDYNIFILRDKAVGGEIALNPFLQQPLGKGNLKVYQLDAVAFRNAAGLSPSAAGPMVAATSVTAGKVEAGLHLIAVAYETDTGFITPPGVFVAAVYTPTQYTAPGGFAIDLSVIPTGPAGTVKRHILASKIIRPPFNGDTTVPELFFVPDGTINDNTTTARNTAGIGAGNGPISFYDTELVSSADYLLDELETIPAGSCYCTYNNRLVIVGFEQTARAARGGGVDVSPMYTARLSNPGLYESFSSIEGFINVFQNDGNALQACWSLNGNLYLAKGNRTYVTRDNGGPPNTWPVELVDAAIGCGPWGVTKIDNSQNSLIEGGAIIGSARGIYFFTGQYSTIPLTYNVEALYRRKVSELNVISDFWYSKYYYDSYRRLLYWLPQTTVGNSHGSNYMLVGSCDNGIDPQNIRWSIFNSFNNLTDSDNNRFIRDIYTTAQSTNAAYANSMLFMIFDSPTYTTIYIMRTTLSLDEQLGGVGGRIYWDLVTFPANVPELDKMQIVGARALIKHDNPDDPIDFDFGAFDYTYNEFTDMKDITLGDTDFPRLSGMVLIPQLYDTSLNVRSKLVGITLARGLRGGNIVNYTFGVYTNSVFIHRLMFFGNRVQTGKLQGSIR